MSHNTIKFLFAVVVLLLLTQYKSTKPYAVGVGMIVLVGYTLTHYTTIRQQFLQLGASPVSGSGGGTPNKYSAN